MWNNFEFTNPWFFLLLLLIPAIIIWRMAFQNKVAIPMKTPSIKAFGEATDWYKYVNPALNFIRFLVLILLIIAMARPRKVDIGTKISSNEGIDIMMVVDVSLSMLARDLSPTRLAALQKVAEEFVNKRPMDRIGIVEYSGEAITKVPLTTDKAILIEEIKNLQMDELEGGTAIGIGLATAINHLEHSKAKSKVVLLITDGGESPVDYGKNMIYISPEDAAAIAAERNIKVYTIGIGTTSYVTPPRGYEHYPQNLFRLDETVLKHIANKTNGLYFRANDNQNLKDIYEEINQLEKTKINEIKYYSYTEYYRYFLTYALIFILIDALFNTIIFRQLT